MAGLLDMTLKEFEQAMDNDFETPVALAACFDLVKEVNKFMDQKTLTRLDKEQLVTFLERIDAVLGIFVPTSTASVDIDVEKLIQERDAARDSKNWKRADEIRDELLAKGIKLEDSATGTKWKKV
jgi:cysteinyl-tRNA synthetase